MLSPSQADLSGRLAKRYTRSTSIILLMVSISMCLGCAMRGPLNWEPDPEPKPYTYHLAKWSRTGVSYQDIQSQIFVRSTLLSPAFSAVLAEEKASRMGLTDADAARLVDESVDAARKELTFFMALATKDPYWNDLDQDTPSLALRLYTNEGIQGVTPLRIQRLGENEISDYRPFFPYADRLTTGYIVTFAMPKTMTRLRLTVSGPPGLADVEWQIDR